MSFELDEDVEPSGSLGDVSKLSARDLPVARGTITHWNEDEGWGAISSDQVPEQVWAHFGAIEGEGYRMLTVGETVDFEWIAMSSPGGQDGYSYRAERVWRRDGSERPGYS